MSRPGGESAISPHSPNDALICAIILDYETMDDLHKVRVALIEDIDKLGRCLIERPLPTEAVL